MVRPVELFEDEGSFLTILGHPEWAEEILSQFSYGEAFSEINSSLLKRYAACTSEEEIKQVQQVWLEKLEREYADSRAGVASSSHQDAWSGGNVNLRPVLDSDDEDGSEADEGGPTMDQAEIGLPIVPDVEIRDPMALSDDSDDEEEMAELRRKVLLSKPFTNAAETTSKSQISTIPPPQPKLVDSDDEPDSDNGEDEDFDNIINATPVTDRTGIQAKQRLKGQEHVSAVFSRTVVAAPRKR